MRRRRDKGKSWIPVSLLVWGLSLLASACQTTAGPYAPPEESVRRTAPAASSDTPRPSLKDSSAAAQRELSAELRGGNSVDGLEENSRLPGRSSPKANTPPAQPVQSPPSPALTSCRGPHAPDWWSLKAPLEDVGDSTVSQEDADKAARVAVIKQLEVHVTGKDVSIQQETTGGAFRYSISSEVVEQVNIGISGLDIVTRHADTCRGRYYARAQLDREKAVHAWQIELRNLSGQRQELMRQVADAQLRRDFLPALDGWARAFELDGTAAQLERRLEYLAPDQRPAEPSARRMEQDRQELEARLGGLQLRKLSGDAQRAVTGAQLDQPLVVRLVGGDLPVRDVPVQFAVEAGHAEVDSLHRTDAQGEVRTAVRQIAGETSGQIVARVSIDQLAGLLPASLRPRLAERTEQLTARFTMLPPVYQVTTRLRTLATDAAGHKAAVAERQQRGDLLHAILPLSRLAEAQEEWVKLIRQLDGLPSGQRPALTDPGDPKATRRQLDQLLDSLQVRKMGGDEQTAKPGKPLAQPLIARVVAALPTGEVAVPDVAVQFTFEIGQGEMDLVTHTDAQGRAKALVRSVAPGTGKSTIAARIAIEKLGLDLPSALSQDVERRLGTQIARFTITPPPAFTEGSLLSKHLHELALRLASGVNTSMGASAVITDFVENRTQRRLSFSSRVEQGLSSGLIKTGVIQVLEEQPGGKQSAKALIFGFYEAESDGGVLISARLRRLTDNGIETTAETTIPSGALLAGDARELAGVQPSPVPAPILPAPSVSESYNHWVEAFWDVRNPSGFTTELVAERAQYQVDEKAVFRFRTTHDCYLTVVSIGASGAWTVLLPNGFRSDPKQTFVRASEGWITIPSHADGFDFTVSRPLGTERVKAICTARPITLVENMDLRQHLFQVPSQDTSRLRDLKVTQATVRREEWSEARAEFRSLDVGQTETSGMRGLRLRGLAGKGGRP